ncbi:FtsQ-type POTRA domain-containing protein [Gulosibacter molinativorax]|uniref:Cell division protein FtsQ n=1 Tax=Gulosibacter molinativorax TaxID=256821 RepID=A0ABT7C5D0_9MICO|nr:FtsQ-type POTRA domain-containing protein [Gulosibacter molinativorax]MDJ1370400.1 cell division protein FtsQ [Gulosibacter molinativorax]QUY61313.1 Cell division protein FtsQ [Gulosibacter molinativorax]
MPETTDREPRVGLFAVWRAALARRRLERREVRRFTRSRRRTLTAWLIGAGTVLFLAAFVAVGMLSPIMSVRQIRVEGTQNLDAAEVESALAGLEGTPLAQLESEDVGALLEGFVLVQSYSIQRLPPSELVVNVVERVPVGVVLTDDETAVVDAAGVTLWHDANAVDSLPIIEVSGGTDTAGFSGAAMVSLALPAELRAEVESISANSTEDVNLTLRDGTEVLWGSVEESPRKAEVFAALRAATEGSSVSLYDVSSPNHPVTR